MKPVNKVKLRLELNLDGETVSHSGELEYTVQPRTGPETLETDVKAAMSHMAREALNKWREDNLLKSIHPGIGRLKFNDGSRLYLSLAKFSVEHDSLTCKFTNDTLDVEPGDSEDEIKKWLGRCLQAQRPSVPSVAGVWLYAGNTAKILATGGEVFAPPCAGVFRNANDSFRMSALGKSFNVSLDEGMGSVKSHFGLPPTGMIPELVAKMFEPGEEFILPIPVACVCGSEKCGFKTHADWCDAAGREA